MELNTNTESNTYILVLQVPYSVTSVSVMVSGPMLTNVLLSLWIHELNIGSMIQNFPYEVGSWWTSDSVPPLRHAYASCIYMELFFAHSHALRLLTIPQPSAPGLLWVSHHPDGLKPKGKGSVVLKGPHDNLQPGTSHNSKDRMSNHATVMQS